MLRYLTHPEVHVDPAVPVPKWSLSARGKSRALAMLAQPWLAAVGHIVNSDETKAIETARLVAEHSELPFEIRSGIGENDRSSLGFVPPGVAAGEGVANVPQRDILARVAVGDGFARPIIGFVCGSSRYAARNVLCRGARIVRSSHRLCPIKLQNKASLADAAIITPGVRDGR